MRVLVLNTGSSSVKYQLVDSSTGERLTGGSIEEAGDQAVALAEVMAQSDASRIDAVGHRVVHGGEVFSEPILIDDDAVAAIRSLVPLAPLHLPANLLGIEAARELRPDVPQVAVFDTAFHRTIPPHAYRYAVPTDWYTEYGVRRFGFHGTSHEYVAGATARLLGRPIEHLDLIVAHLGNGASITAVQRGRSIDTSMGLSPLEGLVMGTRSGDVDPAVILHVAAASGRPPADVTEALNRESGLFGLCGSSDMREVESRADAGDEAAELALDVFCSRVRKYVGAYLAVLGRCDAIAFTGGIGEHSATVRFRSLVGLDALGISIDAERNTSGAPIISAAASPITIAAVPTDEEGAIARQVAALVGG